MLTQDEKTKIFKYYQHPYKFRDFLLSSYIA